MSAAGDGPGSVQLTALRWRFSGEVDADAHSTSWHRLSIRLGGSAPLERSAPDGRSFPNRGGAVSLHPAWSPFGNAVHGNIDLLILCISPARLLRLANADGWAHPRGGATALTLEPIFAAVDAVITGVGRLIATNPEMFANSPLFRDSMERLVARRMLAGFAGFSPPAGSTPLVEADDEPRMAEAIALLGRDPAIMPTIEELAAVAELPVTRFLYEFRALTGRTPQAFHAARRVCAARRLILETTLSFGEIAHRMGFPSQAAMTMACRRHYGMSPRELRAKG
ncbi:MAG: AraC family transcriptional regulator [Pseudomonadota bacterium]